jgi:tetratricopeptide (TPR) repeat protein
MLALDAERVGIAGVLDQLLVDLPSYEGGTRFNVATRMRGHDRFADVAAAALATEPGDDIADELYGELGDAILERVPELMSRLVPALPANVNLLAGLAFKAVQADQRDHAIALYERLLELPIPDDGGQRTNYLRALNNACVQAHAAKAYDQAVRIADRAQPVAHENPYIYHAAACAYAAVGDYAKAFQQVKLAVEHEYDHLTKVENDSDLGPLLEWPEFKALFRDWRARQEGN